MGSLSFELRRLRFQWVQVLYGSCRWSYCKSSPLRETPLRNNEDTASLLCCVRTLVPGRTGSAGKHGRTSQWRNGSGCIRSCRCIPCHRLFLRTEGTRFLRRAFFACRSGNRCPLFDRRRILCLCCRTFARAVRTRSLHLLPHWAARFYRFPTLALLRPLRTRVSCLGVFWRSGAARDLVSPRSCSFLVAGLAFVSSPTFPSAFSAS
mmetsp:Transcript_9364/g.57102  ORF Transcript_9364/g.57102 Transcript_9364/m.57102 type:complete len:207 (-) Transcript_9364:150-770(-)